MTASNKYAIIQRAPQNRKPMKFYPAGGQSSMTKKPSKGALESTAVFKRPCLTEVRRLINCALQS